jgi:hypothetical protein
MREKPTAWPKSGRANPTLVGAFAALILLASAKSTIVA